jgi:hypothetical protein
MSPHTNHPFASTPPSTEQLQAYVQGRLAPAEQHDVERALEADPLLREATEGLQEAHALGRMDHLKGHRPRAGAWRWGIGAGTVVLVISAWLWTNGRSESEAARSPLVTAQGPTAAHPVDSVALAPLPAVTIAAAHELPVAEQIGHRTDERHSMATAPAVMREPAPERLQERLPDTALLRSTPDNAPVRAARPVPPLLYLHDMKLVHPAALYPRTPEVALEPGGLDARYADRSGQTQQNEAPRMQAYIPFVDAAMERFAAADHKAALTDLQFLLGQYPNDVNAQFYAGLCCYNLGLYPRALQLLQRAATHPVTAFDEEADWYVALTLQRMQRSTEAQVAFTRIAERGGFYAERAREQAPR